MDYKEPPKVPRHPDAPDNPVQEFSRFTLYFRSYLEQPQAEAVGHEARYSEMLQTNEQHYERRTQAKPTWEPIDIGWLDEAGVSHVIIENTHGRGLARNPSPEEREEIDKHVIEVAYPPFQYTFTVPPGHIFWARPSDIEHLHYRCAHGRAKCKVVAYPK